MVLCLFPTQYPEKLGMVCHDGVLVRKIVDKPRQTDLTHMWGCMVWSPRFTEHLHTCQQEQHIMDFATVMNLAIQQGYRLRAFQVDEGDFIDLGTYEESMELDRRLRD